VLLPFQKTFGRDSRVQLISMSSDETAEVAEQYIKENCLIWTHGFVSNLIAGASAGEVYKVREVPATVLIGPDARILYVSAGSSGVLAPCQSATIHTVSSRTR